MKKLLPILLASMAVSAFAEDSSASVNTLGILRVDSTLASTIVAVPWVALNVPTNDTPISVADYVKTDNLSDGDYLHAYDADGIYKTWRLANNAWTPVASATEGDNTTETPPAANAYGLTYGSALWIERQNPTNNVGQANPFYLVGQVPLVGGTRPFTGGTTSAPVWNLVASSSTSPISLSAISGGGAADEIYLVNDDEAPTKFYKKNGSWGSDQYVYVEARGRYVLRFVAATAENSVIPAGTGFWYVSTSDTAPVIP